MDRVATRKPLQQLEPNISALIVITINIDIYKGDTLLRYGNSSYRLNTNTLYCKTIFFKSSNKKETPEVSQNIR